MKKSLAIVLLLSGVCFGQGCSKISGVKAAESKETNIGKVDEILAKLNERAEGIKTYHCSLMHLSRQPLFDSQTLRAGEMYYLRDKKQSLLRVDFNTLKQDDEPEENYKEQFFFDGIWLTRIDYQLKEVRKHQLIDPNELKENENVDAFDLISEHLPIVGFTGTEKLQKEFDISLSDTDTTDANGMIELHMDIKPDSVYKDDWVWINFWIDKELYLPAKMVTLTTEEDFYEISFLNASVNEGLNDNVFQVQIPDGFAQPEVIPLRR